MDFACAIADLTEAFNFTNNLAQMMPVDNGLQTSLIFLLVIANKIEESKKDRWMVKGKAQS